MSLQVWQSHQEARLLEQHRQELPGDCSSEEDTLEDARDDTTISSMDSHEEGEAGGPEEPPLSPDNPEDQVTPDCIRLLPASV